MVEGCKTMLNKLLKFKIFKFSSTCYIIEYFIFIILSVYDIDKSKNIIYNI